jgi:hypothetical protein
MSDDTTPPPKPPAAKRAPRRRTTPAMAAAVPKAKRARSKPEVVEGTPQAPAAAEAAGSPVAAPVRPRRRKAAAPAAKSVLAKRATGKAGASAAADPAAEPVVAPKKPRTRKAKAKPPVETPVVAQPVELETAAAEPAAPLAQIDGGSSAEAAEVSDTLGLALGESPVDLPGAARDEAGGLRWASAILLIASPLLLVFNSHAIDNWARQLPVNSWSGPVIDAAIGWHATMQRIGFAAPVDAGRAGWKRLKAAE